MNLDVSSACFFREPAEQVAEAPAEQRLEVSLRRAMGVQLQEDVVANSWRQIEPAADPRWCGHVVSGDLSGFQAGLQACAESQPGGTGNHKQVTSSRSEEHTSELQSLRHLVC